MAKAKKKLNTKFLVTAATIAIAVGVAGAGGGYMVYRAKRPDQLKAEGRELMEEGRYDEAFKKFSRAGARKATDPEFLTWMQETETHLTSFDPIHYRASYMLLSTIINASADKFPPTLKKIDADLIDIENSPIDQMNQERARDLEATAKTVLEREPKNAKAYRINAYAKIIPLFQPGASLTSAETQTVVESLKEMIDEVPGEPDVVYRYAQSLLKHREAQIRELAITDSPTSQQAVALYKEYRRLSDVLLALGNDETLPAEDRARAHARNYEMLQLLITLRLTPRDDLGDFLLPRLSETITSASTLMPVTSPWYLTQRLRHAGFLLSMVKSESSSKEAEKILRDTMEALPKQWQPRIALANALAEQGRALEAVELLSIEKKPDYDLVGIAGVLFNRDSDAVPMHRAYFRLQSLASLPPDKHEAEIARIEEDYKAAISKPSLGGESNPYALQIQAGLQEVRQDRTGALQTLNQALTKMSDTPQYAPLRMKILDQLIKLNMGLSQTGRAAEIAEMLVTANPGDIANTIRYIELTWANNEKVKAAKLLEAARRQWSDQPALAALAIRMAPDEAAKRLELDKIPEKGSTPEKTRQLVEIKMKLASAEQLDAAVVEIADRFLKDNPTDKRVTLFSVQSLLKQKNRTEALRRIASLRAKDPADEQVIYAESVVKAENDEELAKILEDASAKSSPVNAKLIEAQKAAKGGDTEGYLRLMREAEALDPTGAVVQQLYFYFMSTARLDDAEAELNKLAKLNRDPAEIRTNRLRIKLARAAVQKSQGKTAEAEQLVDQASSEANLMVAEMPQFSGAWLVKGLALNTRSQFAEARDAFRSALEAQPNNLEAVRYLVDLSRILGRGDEMLEYINRGKDISPADPYFDEAKLIYEVTFGDPLVAIEPRLKQRDAAPDNESTWLVLGNTYEQAAANMDEKGGDQKAISDLRKKAIDTFMQAKSKFPGSPAFGLAAASIMRIAGDTAGAQAVVDELNADPKAANDPKFLVALTEYYLGINELGKGIEVLQKRLDAGKENAAQLRGQMAQLYAATGQIDQSMAMLDSIPESPGSRELRLNLLLSAKKVDEANKLANSYLEKEKSVTNLLMTSHTELLAGNVAKSIQQAEEAVKLDPTNANAHLYLARAMSREVPPRNPQILETLEKVKELAPSNAEAQMLISERLAVMGRVDEAIGALETLFRATPGNTEAAVRLIQGYRSLKSVPYNRIDEIFATLKQEKRMDAQMLSLQTSIALQRGDIKGAVAAAKEAAESDPNNIGLYRQLVDVMIRAEQYKDVVADLDRIQAKNPNVFWTYMMRGLALHRQKKEAEAIQQWDKALSMTMSLRDDSPTGEVVQKFASEYGADATANWLQTRMSDDPRLRAIMLNLYSYAKRFDKAIEFGETLMPLPDSFNRPTKIMVLNSLGNAYLASTPARPDKARSVFEQLIQIDADNALATNNLAYAILLEGNDLPAAVRYAQTANDLSVKAGTPNAYIADTYGWALVRSGKVQEGIDALRAASMIEDIPDAAYHLGEAYMLENQKEAALESLQKALDLLKNLRQNGGSVDSTLEENINKALQRAASM
jgi:tetratricopeptide (TPR) repeat protein